MPILVPARGDAELLQGDLLQQCRLFFWHVERADKPVGAHDDVFALVITRDCGAERGTIVVARVVLNAVTLPRRDEEGKTPQQHYEDLKTMFEHLREGAAAPDSFYLGTLPGNDQHQRLTAHLDELAQIKLPGDRASWIAKHRVATLSDSFKRSLPVRLFGAYAQVGHDDVKWMCTSDLEALVNAGREYRAALEAKASRLGYGLGQSQSVKVDKKAHAGPQKHLDEASKALEDFEQELSPYQAELLTRQAVVVEQPPSEAAATD